MSLNIKNERVLALAKQAAQATGRSQTGAIEEALERLLRDYGTDPETARLRHRLDMVRGIAVAYAEEPARTDREIDQVEDLFDPSDGLPR